MKIQAALLAFTCLAVSPAWAINKCSIDGKVVFQDTACPGKGEVLVVRPSGGQATESAAESAARSKVEIAKIEWRSKVQIAIGRGEPLVGMTRAELDSAMGAPTQVNADNYGGRKKDQIIYDRPGQSWYVYTDDGVVTSIQHRPGVSSVSAPSLRCPTPHEIRDMETSASSNTLSEAERVARFKQIGQAKSCGR